MSVLKLCMQVDRGQSSAWDVYHTEKKIVSIVYTIMCKMCIDAIEKVSRS